MWTIAILMLLWQAVAAHAGPLEDCEQAQDIDRRIHGCADRIRQFPRDAAALFNRGSGYLSKGDPDNAIADYTRVIQIDPGYSPAYYNRGIANEGKDQHDQAIADFSKAVEINPRHAGAFNARARAYLEIGQRMLALADARRAVTLDPFDEQFLHTRANVYEALGHAQEAIADYRRVLASNPSMKPAADGLGRLGASLSASNAPSGAASKGDRSLKQHHYTAQAGYSREEVECERAQQDDPTGYFAGYPCWAREALSRRARR